MYNAVISLYTGVKYCVRLNGSVTQWFNVRCGLKQGCLLSPLLFNIFINDLLSTLKSLDIGVEIDGEKICVLAYADDIVLIAENEADLNVLLDCLDRWCCENKMTVNHGKSKVIHCRNPSTTKTNCVFKCGETALEVVDSYCYLGLLITEHLDYKQMAKNVAISAGRALGLLISRFKSMGGMQFKSYTKLYDSMVWSIIEYGSSIWGSSNDTHVNVIQNRAMKFFMGLRKYAPNVAVAGDMGWTPPTVRIWGSITRQYVRLNILTNKRVNHRIFNWTKQLAGKSKRNWVKRLEIKLRTLEIPALLDVSNGLNMKVCISKVKDAVFNEYICNWNRMMNRPETGNKLRTYCTFKSYFGTEQYILTTLPRSHRRALALFRCGVAPLRIETGRYCNTPLAERCCYHCDVLEDEAHVILHCPLYTSITSSLLDTCFSMNVSFNDLSDFEKLSYIMSCPVLMKMIAKTCKNILEERKRVVYKS